MRPRRLVVLPLCKFMIRSKREFAVRRVIAFSGCAWEMVIVKLLLSDCLIMVILSIGLPPV